VVILRGRRFRAGAVLDRAESVDVLPTLLYALGLPIAQDLDGRVLTQAFDPAHLASHPLTYVPSYEGLSQPPGP
jgi:arylsulfatase A-like enzyme